MFTKRTKLLDLVEITKNPPAKLRTPKVLIFSIGNHTTLSSISKQFARVDFQKVSKLHESVGRMQFELFEKLTRKFV